MGGLYDQIAIGVTTNKIYSLNDFIGYKSNSVAYHADDGKCYINGKALEVYGPRYGSLDVVGCGITGDGNVFFTLNGMLLPLIEASMQGMIYPVISMRGKFSTVSVV